MNELHVAYRIKQHLNRGLQDIEPSIGDRLRKAREAALGKQKVAEHAPVFVGAGAFVQHHIEGMRPRHLIVAALLFLATVAYTQWHAARHVAELEAVDSALLADDMPIEAFVDRGFEEWLKSSSED